jgi:glucose-1-phosphate cytidylyltransferase
MQVVILAGGLGTRLSEETDLRPKPMVEIGGKPILWHIMKLYSAHGINDFIICCGYKGYIIKEYFANYSLHLSDVTFDFGRATTEFHNNGCEPWRVTLVDTGAYTSTGGRLKRVARYLERGTFCFTYGDGLSDVNVSELVEFHKRSGGLATVTGVQPPGRFGSLSVDDANQKVRAFIEKPLGDGGWINAGFFVLEPAVLDYIDGDQSVWEEQPLNRLAREGYLHVYKHKGFWQPMDTLRDSRYLNGLWDSGSAPWAGWQREVTPSADFSPETPVVAVPPPFQAPV